MSTVAAVYGGSAPHHRSLREPRYARHLDRLVYLPDLPGADLGGVECLVVPERLHRGRLHAARPRLLELLGAGATVVLFGEQGVLADQPEAWLPGLRWEHRPTNFWWWLEPGADSGLRPALPDHPLFSYLTLSDATWHHHGVLFPPAGAEVVIATAEGEAILYVDRVSTPGTLIAATLDPLYHFGSYFMPATGRFLDGFLPWLGDGAPG